MSGKVAIITGSGSGIGAASALQLASHGWNIVINYANRADSAKAVAKACEEQGGGALLCKANVSEDADCQRMAAEAMAKWGRIDCLVNNAGIVADAQMKNMTEEQFDNVIEINLKGVYNCTKAVVNTMLAQQSGVILNASSIVGLYGNFGQTNYAASKFAVIGMMKTWARELGRKGIRANAICPGFISTSILTSIPDKVLKALEAYDGWESKKHAKYDVYYFENNLRLQIGRADIDHETVDRGLLSNCLVRLPDPGENASPPIRSRRCWNLRYYGGTCGVRETHRDRNRRRSALIGTNGATDQWHQKGNSRNAPPEPVKRPRLVCTLKN